MSLGEEERERERESEIEREYFKQLYKDKDLQYVHVPVTRLLHRQGVIHSQY